MFSLRYLKKINKIASTWSSYRNIFTTCPLPCNYICYLPTESHFTLRRIIRWLFHDCSTRYRLIVGQTIEYEESQFQRIIELYCINEVFCLLENSPIAKLRCKVLVSFVCQFPIINLERLDISRSVSVANRIRSYTSDERRESIYNKRNFTIFDRQNVLISKASIIYYIINTNNRLIH